MNVKEFIQLYHDIKDCSCVNKGDSDDNNLFKRFKLVCADNMEIIQGKLDELQGLANEKAVEMIMPDYAKFDQAAEMLAKAGGPNTEREIKKLAKKYKKEIASFDAFHKWLNEDYYGEDVTEHIQFPDLVLWEFELIPEKINGSYMRAIAPMINNMP